LYASTLNKMGIDKLILTPGGMGGGGGGANQVFKSHLQALR
jgi:hypothetical protein